MFLSRFPSASPPLLFLMVVLDIVFLHSSFLWDDARLQLTPEMLCRPRAFFHPFVVFFAALRRSAFFPAPCSTAVGQVIAAVLPPLSPSLYPSTCSCLGHLYSPPERSGDDYTPYPLFSGCRRSHKP